MWVVGLYESESGHYRFAIVEYRDADTLLDIILRNVSKDSKLVITDGWKGYWSLKKVSY